MTPKCPTRAGALRFLTVMLVLALGLGATATQTDAAGAAPANAHMKRYGRDWECNRGYTKQAQSCVVIEVPANAHLDPNGIGWTCNRGYEQADGRCSKVEVPANGFLSSRGNEWDCDRGYSKVDQSCIATAVPENGSKSLKEATSRDRAMISNATGATSSETSLASRSSSLRTAISTGPEPTGAASAASRSGPARAWPSRCHRTLTSTSRGQAGLAIPASRRAATPVARTAPRRAGPLPQLWIRETGVLERLAGSPRPISLAGFPGPREAAGSIQALPGEDDPAYLPFLASFFSFFSFAVSLGLFVFAVRFLSWPLDISGLYSIRGIRPGIEASHPGDVAAHPPSGERRSPSRRARTLRHQVILFSATDSSAGIGTMLPGARARVE